MKVVEGGDGRSEVALGMVQLLDVPRYLLDLHRSKSVWANDQDRGKKKLAWKEGRRHSAEMGGQSTNSWTNVGGSSTGRNSRIKNNRVKWTALKHISWDIPTHITQTNNNQMLTLFELLPDPRICTLTPNGHLELGALSGARGSSSSEKRSFTNDSRKSSVMSLGKSSLERRSLSLVLCRCVICK